MSGVAWWSQTAANNATFDPSISWAEGMAPSSVNDSARAEMASVKKWADDIAGATVTGGSSTAFTLTTYQSFDTLARLNGNLVAFTPHATNGATVTLNVDGLGNPYSIPVGGVLPYTGASAPNSSFVLPYGQATRTTPA